MLFCGETVFAQAYVWKSVAIKGGGFVSGIITHPNASGVIYCRTDIGGAYRWNSTNNSWTPLLDFAADDNIYGVESLAIDPSDSNRLYIAASRGSPSVLLVSTNQGARFSQFTPPFALNGNVDGFRSNGERMDVDYRTRVTFCSMAPGLPAFTKASIMAPTGRRESAAFRSQPRATAWDWCSLNS